MTFNKLLSDMISVGGIAGGIALLIAGTICPSIAVPSNDKRSGPFT
jgi:preprotein translocase subunit SecY